MQRKTLFFVSVVGALFLAFSCFTAIPSRATDEALVLGLKESIQRALETSTSLKGARFALEEAEADLGQAEAGRLPRLEAHSIFGIVPAAHGSALVSSGSASRVLEDLGPFTRMEISLVQPLYTFGRLGAHIEAARAGLESEEAAVARSRAELVFDVKELYYLMLLNRELKRLVTDTVERFDEAVRKAEEMLDDEEYEGTITQTDILKLRYGHARAREELARLRNGAAMTDAAFRRLLGLGSDEPFNIEDKGLRPVKASLEPLDHYLALALENRPELTQLAAGIRGKEADLEAERKELRPDLFLAGMFRYAVAPNRTDQANPFVLDEFNYLDGGLVLGWHMGFDFGHRHRVGRKEAELFGLEEKKREAESGLRLEVERAYRTVLEKGEATKAAREARKSGRALATLAVANFHMGLGEAKEVFESLHIYAESAANNYLTIKDHNVAWAELSRVAGTEVTGLEY